MASETATLAGGCFWCTEAVFLKLKGVTAVRSGYSGGQVVNPTYEQVCTGRTGHAEAIQIDFDPEVISFEQLLDVFFQLHDPTTLNQQGNDHGPQYRSAIFYNSEAQKETAEKVKAAVDASSMYHNKVVTEITPFSNFYEAEQYHQDFYERNRDYPYCQVIIDPKIQKLYKNFKDLTAAH